MLKTAVLIALSTLFSLFLLGCQQEKESTPTVTAVAQQPTATATILPTITASATITATETAVVDPSATPSPTVTATPTTSSPTPKPLATISLSNFDEHFQIAAPTLDNLLQVMVQASLAENLTREQRSNWSKTRLLYPLLFADISQFDTDAYPDVTYALTDSSSGFIPSHYPNWYPSEAHIPILMASIEQTLNQSEFNFVAGKEIREGAFSILPIQAKANGDDVRTKWLMLLESANFRRRFLLLLEQNEDGTFSILGDPIHSYSYLSWPDNWINNIHTEHDLTGNEVEEIIIEMSTYYSGTGTDTTFDIFSWQNDAVIQLENISVFEIDGFEIADLTGDGITDLQTINNHYRNFGCEWSEIDTYSWPNQVSQHIDPEDSVPDTAVCNLWQAAQPYNIGRNPDKEDNYPYLLRSVTQFQEGEQFSSDLHAYALSQLAFAYLEQGLNEKARETIDQIYELPHQSSYAQYLQQHDTTGSMIDLCRNLNVHAQQALDTELGNYLNEAATYGRGYMWEDPAKAHICDLRYIVLKQLQNGSLPSSKRPTSALEEISLQLDFAHSANIDDDPELEWIGILESETPWLIVFDDVNNIWHVSLLDDLFYPIIALELGQQDVTNNGQLETLLAMSFEPSYGAPFHTIWVLGQGEEQLEILGSHSDFAAFPDVHQVDTSLFNLKQTELELEPEPDWQKLDGFEIEESSIKSYVEKLTDNVITQTDPNITTKITDLLNYLPTDDPEAQPYREHLIYLLGYHYELSGAEDNAVAIYLDLIQQNPDSPWSWLAWARLDPLEK